MSKRDLAGRILDEAIALRRPQSVIDETLSSQSAFPSTPARR
jgi:hypothetical protein